MTTTRNNTPTPVDAGGAGIPISDEEFGAFQRLILDETGIALHEGKRHLLVSRLSRRLRHHGVGTFADYWNIVHGDTSGAELRELLNAITTNKTEFFRESHHFDTLKNRVIPEAIERARRSGERRLRIWCAASSTGEEPYSIAMTVREALGDLRAWDVKILATDIDTEVLRRAREGRYTVDKLDPIPRALRKRYFTPDGPETERVVPELQEMLAFRQLNLVAPTWPIKNRFDVIFCRNVVIYFTRDTQQVLFGRLTSLLHPHGYLFVGHSESLHWLPNLLRADGLTTYRPIAGAAQPAAPRPAAAIDETAPADKAVSRPAEPKPAPRRPQPAAKRSASTADVPLERIQIGGVFASRTPAIVSTVLGSCIAVCVFDPVTGVGGMNHFMLPDGDDAQMSTRYGVHAMETLINEVMKLGGERARLKAKIFGGSHVLRSVDAAVLAIGERNTAFVIDFLRKENIPIVARRLGGEFPMHVEFHTDTARARVRLLGERDADQLRNDELAFRRRTKVETPRAGDVTLF